MNDYKISSCARNNNTGPSYALVAENQRSHDKHLHAANINNDTNIASK